MGSPENPDQLVIALEPKAAAIFLSRKILVIFRGKLAVDLWMAYYHKLIHTTLSWTLEICNSS